MRRTGILVAILVLVAVSAAAQGQPDFSQVQIKPTKINDKFYTLEGQGGMIGILTGPDGVFMVDAQFAPLSGKIAAAIKQITPGPIRFIVNTHVHGDHTGGNENFAKMGAVLFSRDQLRARLAQPGGNAQPAPAAALPVVTYDNAVTIHMNGEDVRLIPIRAAHTDGDTLVHFPGLDILMTGDYYRSVGYPNIDRANGGTLNGKTILSAESVATMTRVQTSELKPGFVPGMGFGFGWGVVREPQGVTAALSAGSYGHGGAFGTQGWLDPARDRFVVLLIQRTGLPNADASPMRQALQEAAAAAK